MRGKMEEGGQMYTNVCNLFHVALIKFNNIEKIICVRVFVSYLTPLPLPSSCQICDAADSAAGLFIAAMDIIAPEASVSEQKAIFGEMSSEEGCQCKQKDMFVLIK